MKIFGKLVNLLQQNRRSCGEKTRKNAQGDHDWHQAGSVVNFALLSTYCIYVLERVCFGFACVYSCLSAA